MEVSDKVGVRAAARGGVAVGVTEGVLTSVTAGISCPTDLSFLKERKKKTKVSNQLYRKAKYSASETT